MRGCRAVGVAARTRRQPVLRSTIGEVNGGDDSVLCRREAREKAEVTAAAAARGDPRGPWLWPSGAAGSAAATTSPSCPRPTRFVPRIAVVRRSPQARWRVIPDRGDGKGGRTRGGKGDEGRKTGNGEDEKGAEDEDEPRSSAPRLRGKEAARREEGRCWQEEHGGGRYEDEDDTGYGARYGG